MNSLFHDPGSRFARESFVDFHIACRYLIVYLSSRSLVFVFFFSKFVFVGLLIAIDFTNSIRYEMDNFGKFVVWFISDM